VKLNANLARMICLTFALIVLKQLIIKVILLFVKIV
jgi:hypothetical protein